MNLTAGETKALLDGSVPPVLLDVREPEEWDICRINGARHVPLGELAERLEEVRKWAAGRQLVVYCHHGIRSLHAAAFLRREGISQVRNLAGGIDAWSVEIDPTVPRY